MRFKNPEYLFLLLSILPVLWLYIRREKKTPTALKFSSLLALKQQPPSLRIRLRHLLIVLQLAGISLLIIALARPQKGVTEDEVTTDGVDIIIVQDVSTSMRALDFKPKNRLFVALETIKEFIKKRSHDRIGLVVFSARAYTRCPLTLDYSVLYQFIDNIKFGQIEDGTAIGTAIATAANRLVNSPAKSRIMILITDGANNRGEIAPLLAAQAAAELGIKIYTIGVGRTGQVPYPFEGIDHFSGQKFTQVQMIQSDLDEQTLTDIAAATKGRYFRASDAERLKEIYSQIDQLEKTEIKSKTFTTYTERFFPWLLFGCLFILLDLLLGQTVFRRIP